ncbi:hypothetical protein AJ79_00768 [Helicocarpus griseus UAMH5409]|uniref:Uncharacterized protein n=1 Tax=Helicocarpus griseus UAMH5409 TaxID=1447875 RepID=A0A2B7YAL5_9EURO|nr:hypothetical protein AJ79_00768 [Helicocarpus griseus UAMH5409]
MPPVTRNKGKPQKQETPSETPTEPDLELRHERFDRIRQKQGGCLILFSGEYHGRGRDIWYWRERLGWEGEKPRRELFHRYEALGNPTSGERNPGTRFSWDIETGQWMLKSEWLDNMIRAFILSKCKGKARRDSIVAVPDPPTSAMMAVMSEWIETEGYAASRITGRDTDIEDTEAGPSGLLYETETNELEGGWGYQVMSSEPMVDSRTLAGAKRKRIASPEAVLRGREAKRGVVLGANTVPEQDEIEEPLAKRRKSTGETLRVPSQAATLGAHLVPKPEETKPRAKRGRKPKSLTVQIDKGELVPEAKITPALELPSKRGRKAKGTAILTTGGEEGDRKKDLPAAGGGVASGNVSPKAEEQKRPPAKRGRKKKVVLNNEPDSFMAQGSKAGDQMVSGEASGETESQETAIAKEEATEKQGPSGQKRKLEISSIAGHGEAAETSGRPKRIRKPSKRLYP